MTRRKQELQISTTRPSEREHTTSFFQEPLTHTHPTPSVFSGSNTRPEEILISRIVY